MKIFFTEIRMAVQGQTNKTKSQYHARAGSCNNHQNDLANTAYKQCQCCDINLTQMPEDPWENSEKENENNTTLETPIEIEQ